ncbi:MAG: ATP-binding protein [Thermoplasmata archaeon]
MEPVRGSPAKSSSREALPEVRVGYDVVEPRADAIAESLRNFGYSLPNAIADLVDNSLSAQSTEVSVTFWWDGPASWVRVRDNGRGMSDADLKEAMRLGTKSPLEPRDSTDLGRFGLGLKTASFSQCRRVTVRSKTGRGAEATRCWDLDVIQRQREFALLRGPADDHAEQVLGYIRPGESSTIILWEAMDRVVSGSPTSDEGAHRIFLEAVREVSRHLGMVFHRFLSGRDAVALTVNEIPVPAWDPFLVNEPSTQPLPVEHFGSGTRVVTVRPFVLPHQSKVTEEVFRAASGPRGWNAQQGFYIYRNQRLIVPGGWLGMFHQEEHFKLARIQLDIGNALDGEWRIDVRKAKARPPDELRKELKRIADATRKRAVEVYRHRGKALAREGAATNDVFVWEVDRRRGKTFYRINREHPLIKHMFEAGRPSHEEVRTALRLIEETIPVPYILGAFTENAEKRGNPYEGAEADLRATVREAAKVLSGWGLRGADLKRALMVIEPFQDYPEVVEAAILEAPTGEG